MEVACREGVIMEGMMVLAWREEVMVLAAMKREVVVSNGDCIPFDEKHN